MFFDETKQWRGEGTLTVSDLEQPIQILISLDLVETSSHFGSLSYEHSLIFQGMNEVVENTYVLHSFEKGKFQIEISNQAWGKILGVGIFTDRFFGFEIGSHENQFQGYEYYQKTEEGFWSVEGEYVSNGDMRSQVKGFIYPATEPAMPQ